MGKWEKDFYLMKTYTSTPFQPNIFFSQKINEENQFSMLQYRSTRRGDGDMTGQGGGYLLTGNTTRDKQHSEHHQQQKFGARGHKNKK